MLKKIDHIGFAVHSIEEARVFYEQTLGLVCEKVEEVSSQKVRVAFFALGDTHIELLEPMDDTSTIAAFLQKNGEGFHHIAYLSDNIEEQLETASNNGCALIHDRPVIGAGGKKIAFLHPKSTGGVLSEISAIAAP